MSDSETCKGTTPEGGHAQSSRAYSEHFQSTFQDWTLTHGLQSERFLSISRAKVIDTGESTSALGRVRAAVAGAVELGLKKKAAILAKALHQINAARQDGFSHAQIHVAITSGGLDLTPAYYENLYAREMRKHHARLAARPPVSQPAPGGLSPLIFGKLEKRPVELKMSESDATAKPGFTSASDELRRARAVSRQDFSQLIKRKNKP